MSRIILEGIIQDFEPVKFARFFREKNRKFAETKENISEYNDGHFINGVKLGEIKFTETEQLAICAFQGVQPLSERSGKKTQYEKAKKILKERQYDAGTFIFYDDKGNFRFSLIYANYLGKKRDWSVFRRHTYFVSPNEPHRTFLERIGNCDFTSLENIKEAFSVEKVTREFYTEYDRVFKGVEALIEGFNNSKEDTDRKRLFTQTLFNRLMFIAFIEKKGWLKYNSQTDYLLSLWKDYRKSASAETNFYRDRLKILFFAGLNTTNDINIVGINKNGILNNLIGDVPYLNGGLFEENLEDQDPKIKIPDKCFQNVIEDLFKRFNFTVTEILLLTLKSLLIPKC